MAAGATVTDRCTQYALDVVAGVIIAAMKEEYKLDTNEVVNEWFEMYEKYMGKGGEKE